MGDLIKAISTGEVTFKFTHSEVGKKSNRVDDEIVRENFIKSLQAYLEDGLNSVEIVNVELATTIYEELGVTNE